MHDKVQYLHIKFIQKKNIYTLKSKFKSIYIFCIVVVVIIIIINKFTYISGLENYAKSINNLLLTTCGEFFNRDYTTLYVVHAMPISPLSPKLIMC